MKKKYLIICSFLLFIAINFLFCPSVNAVSRGFLQGVENTGSKVGVLSTEKPEEIATRAVSAMLALLGVVFIALFVYAGFLYMTSQGDEPKIKKSKKLMLSAVIGLLIIFGAFIISLFVSQALEKATLISSTPTP